MNKRSVQLILEEMPAPEAVRVKQRLDALRDDCGCHVGALVMLGVTASWIVHTLLVPTAGRSWQRTVAIGFAVLMTSALIGKLIGLGLARLRLYMALRRLQIADRHDAP